MVGNDYLNQSEIELSLRSSLSAFDSNSIDDLVKDVYNIANEIITKGKVDLGRGFVSHAPSIIRDGNKDILNQTNSFL